MKNNKMVILYDGYCPTCNFSVKIAARVDKEDLFRYSPLQSEYSMNFIKSHPELKEVDSIILKIGDSYLLKSDAVIEILKKSTWPIKAFYYFKYIPKSIRDIIYDFIARNRTKLTGRYETCEIPHSILGKIL